jgi:hypothetical protein
MPVSNPGSVATLQLQSDEKISSSGRPLLYSTFSTLTLGLFCIQYSADIISGKNKRDNNGLLLEVGGGGYNDQRIFLLIILVIIETYELLFGFYHPDPSLNLPRPPYNHSIPHLSW